MIGSGDRTGMASRPARTIASPVGDLMLVADRGALVAILWPDDRVGRVALPPLHPQPDEPVLVEAAIQLRGYFAGNRKQFDLPLAPHGTLFQQRVWAALRTIPYGETRSYAAIAAQLGSPAAVRAVGAANGRNPLSIVVPCHRVIGSGGRLTGFAGGLAAKQYLLSLEAPAAAPMFVWPA
jgi:methylated-DNA-[protein]-cysteine S-methyltransferase